jgi:SanA protein
VLKKIAKMLFHMLLILIPAAVLIFGLPRLYTQLYAQPKTYPLDNAPGARVAIVFGAGLHRDGSPTPVLQDRVTAAARLYFSGRVEKVLMSGDNRYVDYNEPLAMYEYALELGIPKKDIVLDYAGRRTYDTCYRARDIFGVKDAILVTQAFHLPRALFICNQLGVSASGVSADLRQYTRTALSVWELREIPATLVALWEVWITHPLPVLGEPEPIFSSDKTSHKSSPQAPL